ncbi:MAG: hypothetical protein QXP43_00030 [Nitrososphaerota archaeon]|nr:hypothetical protein [Candidatus Calditenuis fumarioli]
MGRVYLALPPRVKVLEALGAVAGGRVELLSEKEARVRSSEGDRVYRIVVDLESGEVISDDNGTVYRNYVGYPIIAVLMKLGRLPYDEKLARHLADVRWRTMNERYRSYRLVEREIARMLRSAGIEWSEVEGFVEMVLRQLGDMNLWKRG